MHRAGSPLVASNDDDNDNGPERPRDFEPAAL